MSARDTEVRLPPPDADWESALCEALPPHLHGATSAFARVIQAAVDGSLTPDAAQARIAADPALAPLAEALAGNTIVVGSTAIVWDQQGRPRIHAVSTGDTIDAASSQGFVNRPAGPVHQVFDNRRVINTGGGDFVDDPERLYDVQGLPNPYLGLRSFTYDDRASFAGRRELVEAAMERLTRPGEQRVLFFVTGASGSGKSSLVQAGLLPALELFYGARKLQTRWAVCRPSRQPLAGLADAVAQLGLPTAELDPRALQAEPKCFARHVETHTPRTQINVLVMDQLEELFTQSDPAERDALVAILEHLAPFSALRTHIIATMRADYLPELFQHQALYDQAKQGLDLRAMSESEMTEAIPRPLYHLLEQKQGGIGPKRFEAALMARLTGDAAGDAALLPLLQVTLEDLWTRGRLMLSAYGSLTDAIRQRAEQVYTYADHAGARATPRSPDAQATIMTIFLDLVEVSLDDVARRDVRRRRRYDELVQGQGNRAALIDDLIGARLLSRSLEARAEGPADVLDIIHETLIGNWARLRQAIAARRSVLRQRVRFEQALAEWEAGGRDDGYLLDGVRLAEAQALDQVGDIAIRPPAARDLLQRSVAVREAERQREIDRERALADEQRQRAAEQQNAARLRVFLVLAGVMLAITFGSIGFAFWTQRESTRRAQREAAALSEAQRLAAQAAAELVVAKDIDHAVLLARAAIQKPEYAEAPIIANTLRQAFEKLPQKHITLQPHGGWVVSVAWSPDGEHILTGSRDGRARIWNARTGALEHALEAQSDYVWSVGWSPDGKQVLTGGWDDTVRIWDVASEHEIRRWNEKADVRAVAWSPDGRQILAGTWDGLVRLYDIASGAVRAVACDPPTSAEPMEDGRAVLSVAWKPDGTEIAAGRNDGYVCSWDAGSGRSVLTFKAAGREVRAVAWNHAGTRLLTCSIDRLAVIWDAASGSHLRTFVGHSGLIRSADWSPDDARIVTGSDDQTARIWDVETGREISRVDGHQGAVWSVAWHPKQSLIVTGSFDKTAQIWLTDSATMVAKLTEEVCKRVSEDDIRAVIATWRGCAVEQQAGQSKLQTYEALISSP